jgi:hypothetical protein
MYVKKEVAVFYGKVKGRQGPVTGCTLFHLRALLKYLKPADSMLPFTIPLNP